MMSSRPIESSANVPNEMSTPAAKLAAAPRIARSRKVLEPITPAIAVASSTTTKPARGTIPSSWDTMIVTYSAVVRTTITAAAIASPSPRVITRSRIRRLLVRHRPCPPENLPVGVLIPHRPREPVACWS